MPSLDEGYGLTQALAKGLPSVLAKSQTATAENVSGKAPRCF